MMNTEEKAFAEKIGFDWVKFFPKKSETETSRTLADELRFYREYLPKFIRYFVKDIKGHWRRFLLAETNQLRVDVYALRSKRLNEKHGEFNPEGSVLSGYSGINKVLEIDTRTASRILKLGKDENELFQREVKARTEPYSHLAKKLDMEKLIEDKQEELKGQGLGEIVGVKMEEDNERREDKQQTESQMEK